MTALGTVSAANPRVFVVDDPDRHGPASTARARPPSTRRRWPSTTTPSAISSSPRAAPAPPKPAAAPRAAWPASAPSWPRCTRSPPTSVCYLAMPLFHSNALMAGWSPTLAAGATLALPTSGRFSASGFLPDVRRHGVTYFNYVGKPLSYILATPEHPDDADNTLTRGLRQRRGRGRPGPLRRPLRLPWWSIPTARPKAGPPSNAPPTPRPARSAGPPTTPWSSTRPPVTSAPWPASTPTDGSPTPRRPSASSSPSRGLPASRATGTTTTPRRPACKQRLVLDRRPGLPRRPGLLLLRRPFRRLAPGGRRELRRRPRRPHPRALPRRRPGRRLRRPRSGHRRPGHGRPPAPPGSRLRPRRLRRLSVGPARHGDQVGTPLRPRGRGPAHHGHLQGPHPRSSGPSAGTAPIPSGGPPTDPGTGYRRLEAPDAAALDEAVADRPGPAAT